MIEQKGYLKIGNGYLEDITLSFCYANTDFIKELLFTFDEKKAMMMSYETFVELRKKLYINLDIKIEDIMFIEKED
nr:MAG TPA: hypothetical protein [Caudoviricetes sp.]